MTTRAQSKENKQRRVSQHFEKLNQADCTPVVYVTVERIQQTLPIRPLIVLLDTGSSHTMIKRTSLPHDTTITSGPPKRTTTTNGIFSPNAQISLHKVKFPEFGNHCIDMVTADVFDSPSCRYDVILGCNILQQMRAY